MWQGRLNNRPKGSNNHFTEKSAIARFEIMSIVPGLNGLLFEHNSIPDLARKIKQWIKENEDTPTELIRNNCYQVIRDKFNSEYQAKLINEIVLKQESD